MKMSKQIRSLVLAAGIAAAASITQAQPGTSFTYQGQLKNNGTLVDTAVVADFSLFDAAAGGTQIGSTISQPITPDEGTFSTDLDFGVAAFDDNQALWLEIVVDGDLLGRQKLSATPFAMNTRGINVNSSGRVGIGTTSQQDILHVTGNNARILTESTSGSFSGIRSRLGTYEYFTGTDGNGVAEPIWHVFDNRTGQRRLALEPSGNFGIGVSDPVTRLQVAGSGSFSGDVGIGTSAPPAALSVVGFNDIIDFTQQGVHIGQIPFADGSGASVNLVGGTEGAQLRFYDTAQTGSCRLWYFPATGELRMDGGILNGFRVGTDLLVTGNAFKPGGGSWSNLSDRKLKKNISELDGALDTLLALRGVTYEYKDAEAINELPGTRTGFIAQDVEEVMPDWVDENEDGIKRLTIRGFEAIAVEAIREQQEQIVAMQAEIDSLKSGGSVVGASYAMPMLIAGAAFGGIALIRRRTK